MNNGINRDASGASIFRDSQKWNLRLNVNFAVGMNTLIWFTSFVLGILVSELSEYGNSVVLGGSDAGYSDISYRSGVMRACLRVFNSVALIFVCVSLRDRFRVIVFCVVWQNFDVSRASRAQSNFRQVRHFLFRRGARNLHVNGLKFKGMKNRRSGNQIPQKLKPFFVHA